MNHLLIAILKYIKPLEEVDLIVSVHREYLKKLLAEKKLLVAGRLHPRTGGIIIAKNVSREEFEKIMHQDPITKVSEFTIIEFIPSFYDSCLKEIIQEETK